MRRYKWSQLELSFPEDIAEAYIKRIERCWSQSLTFRWELIALINEAEKGESIDT